MARSPVVSTRKHPVSGPRGAILTGHVDRLGLFADLMLDVRDVDSLSMPAIQGDYDGTPAIVVGTGMGGPATVRAMTELLEQGCRLFVRAGGAGPVGTGPEPGDLVVATSAVRHEGASAAFLPVEWPAVADPVLSRHLWQAAQASGARSWVGVIHSKDSFYGEVDPDSSPVGAQLRAAWSAWQRLGVLASEMEAAALFAVAMSAGVAAGAIVRINDVNHEPGTASDTQRLLCHTALTGLVNAMKDGVDV